MRFQLKAFASILLVTVGTLNGHAVACEGRVLAGAAAVPGVLVSDGRDVAVTDGEGRYRLSRREEREVFVVAPDGWTVPRAADGLPAFWRRQCGDFALVPQPSPGATLRVLVFSDPQTGTQAQVDDYARSIVDAARGERDVALGLTLGDVSEGAAALYPALNRATTSLGVPWLHVAGNHDADADARDDAEALASFRAVYGPDTFAWQSPQAVFVGLDNVVSLPGERPAYVGGLREDQFAFLQQLLPHLPRDRLLVIAAHIPWFDTSPQGRAPSVRVQDRERLFELLRTFPNVLLLSGHRHTQRQFFHDADTGWHGMRPLHEYNVGAASGAYWSGVTDAHGIPDAMMADGTPKGYAVLEVAADAGYALDWRPVGLPVDDPAQTATMALHAPKVLRQGAYPAWGVFANVYMGHDGTRVEYRIDDGAWVAMTKFDGPDPRLLLENARDDLAETLRGHDRSPEAQTSTHLWRGALDTRLPVGVHRVEVRAFDAAGIEHRASIDYRLEAWQQRR